WRIKGGRATMRRGWSEGQGALGRAQAVAGAIRHPRQGGLSRPGPGRRPPAEGRRDDAREGEEAAGENGTAPPHRTRDPRPRARLASARSIRELEDLVRG